MSLDGEIARRLFGYYHDPERRGPFSDWHQPDCGGPGLCMPDCGFSLRSYSTAIDAAFLVVEHMREAGYPVDIQGAENKGGWRVSFQPHEFPNAASSGPILPDCICRAALQVIGTAEVTTKNGKGRAK